MWKLCQKTFFQKIWVAVNQFFGWSDQGNRHWLWSCLTTTTFFKHCFLVFCGAWSTNAAFMRLWCSVVCTCPMDPTDRGLWRTSMQGNKSSKTSKEEQRKKAEKAKPVSGVKISGSQPFISMFGETSRIRRRRHQTHNLQPFRSCNVFVASIGLAKVAKSHLGFWFSCLEAVRD